MTGPVGQRKVIPKFLVGRAIVAQVVKEHGILLEDFFGRHRDDPLMDARRDAVMRMRAIGYSWARIARVIKRHKDTVRYYVSESSLLRKRNAMRERRAFKFLSPDVIDLIVTFAKIENIKPELLIAQWAAERALYEIEAKRRAA